MVTRLAQLRSEGRLMLFDGAMGTMIMRHGLTEEDFRGEEFREWPVLLRGNNDLLVLTKPDIIANIHRQYLEAGADFISTCTFSSQRISQQEYRLTDYCERMCREGVRIARAEVDRMKSLTPDQPRYVLGDIGPTSRMLSMSEDVENPSARSITFDELESAFMEQMTWLVEGGVDGLLVETIFDTLNAKAAISAYKKLGSPVPLFLSMTVSDNSGRTLSGQTIEAFCTSVAHSGALCVGMNCGLGPDGMVPLLRQMRRSTSCYVSCHPNAGLPNAMGQYDVTPELMAQQMQPMLDEGLVDIVGGCCGTTPEHIKELRKMTTAPVQKTDSVDEHALRLAGIDAFAFSPADFVVVGERCNVAGSRKFLRLINEKNYDEALAIARKQVEQGAMVVDINMDDGLLDAKAEMRTFVNLIASDPSIARVPLMIDSSRFDVIEEGLKCCQGKAIVNSISLKQGEEEFLRQARIVKRLGAAVIVMCFDEQGQATDYERRIQICQRAYDLLTKQVGFDATDIIFDPNVLTIATGMEEHANYARDFIRATQWITENLPGTRVSGGLSNLSFAFRGNNYLREAMHSVFLHLARKVGMGMAIMNPATAVQYDSIDADLRDTLEAVILNTNVTAIEHLMELAAALLAEKEAAKQNASAQATAQKPQVPQDAEQRLIQALLKGETTTLAGDLQTLLEQGKTPLDIISGPLMQGMNEVGRLFGEGKMFLPQVVKTARTMKQATAILLPSPSATQEQPTSDNQPRILLATVKGDVHDIGKNIVGVVLACNGFHVIDLGVMVPCETIVEQAISLHADIICLSGLITPSLDEMCRVADAMQKAGLQIPLFVGGATTSLVHTAVKIAELYSGGVYHLRDASQDPVLATQLLDPRQRDAVKEQNLQQQRRIRLAYQQREQNRLVEQTKAEARGQLTAEERRFTCDWEQYLPVQPPFVGQRQSAPIPVSELVPLIDWLYFFWAWRVKEDSEEGRMLKADAMQLLDELAKNEQYAVRAITAFYPAVSSAEGLTVTVNHGSDCPCCGGARRVVAIDTPRQKTAKRDGTLREQCLSLCDFVSPLGKDYVGAFAVTMSETFVERLETLKQSGEDDYMLLLLQTVGDRLAEAASEYLARIYKKEHAWGGIRPAVGYPSLPDQRTIFQLAQLIDFGSIGITLTENGAMYPQSSVCGLYIAHPQATYFNID